jgi:hypothetical protein
VFLQCSGKYSMASVKETSLLFHRVTERPSAQEATQKKLIGHANYQTVSRVTSIVIQWNAGLLTGSAVCGIPLNYNGSNSLVTG